MESGSVAKTQQDPTRTQKEAAGVISLILEALPGPPQTGFIKTIAEVNCLPKPQKAEVEKAPGGEVCSECTPHG